MFSVADKHALCIFLRTSLWCLPTSSFTATSTSVDQPHNVHNDVVLWNLLPGVLLFQLPSEWRVFHRLSWGFLLTIAHPGAAHLHRYNLLLLVVYYPRINSVSPEILVLSEDWDVPVCLYIRSLIYRLWLSWWIPRWRRFSKSQVFHDVKKQDLQNCVMPCQVLCLGKRRTSREYMSHALWCCTAQPAGRITIRTCLGLVDGVQSCW